MVISCGPKNVHCSTLKIGPKYSTRAEVADSDKNNFLNITESITTVKSFIVQAPGPNIKLTCVINECSN